MQEKIIKELKNESEVSKLLSDIFKNVSERAEKYEGDNMVMFLENEKWYPMSSVTDEEYHASQVFNKVLEDLISKTKNGFRD